MAKKINDTDDVDQATDPQVVDHAEDISDEASPDPAKEAQDNPGLASALAAIGSGDQDRAPSSMPDSTPKKDDLSDLLLTPQMLAQARQDKMSNSRMGAIADNLSNRQSFGNFFLGHMNPHVDAAAPFQAANDSINQGIQGQELLQKQALMTPELQNAKDAMDAGSDYSKAKQAELQSTLQALQKFGQIDGDKAQNFMEASKSLNAFQVDKILQTLKPQTDILRAQGMLNIAGARLDLSRKRFDQGTDNQTNKVTKDFDTDPLIQSTQRQINQIGIDTHTIKTAPMLTPQMVHEIGNGIAMALSGGKAVGLGMAEMQDLGTLQTTLAAAEQRLSNSPQDGASPEMKQQMVDTLDRLKAAYQKVQGSRANQLKVGKHYAHNPAANQAIDDKVRSYQEPSPQPSGGMITIHNAKTGETLKIPSEHLSDAQKDGFEQVQ